MIQVINVRVVSEVNLYNKITEIMTLYQKTLADFQENYVGYAALVVIGQSCFGAAAVMYVLENGIGFIQLFQMLVVVLSCMMLNVSILSQQPPKLVFNFMLCSVGLSILLIAINAMLLYA